MSETGEPREWIIQRCTQQWIGIELQYEDWCPAGRGTMSPVTRSEMMAALKSFDERWPDEEFRGHRVVIEGSVR